ncbi:MAG: MYXO-CTERM sorting domain-containing protein [Minicystis sp.]
MACQKDSDCGDAASGKVCDDTTHTCVNGCRGSGGNGCPEGETCSSMSGAVGMCTSGTGGAGGDADGVVPEGNGVLCAASPRSSDDNGAGWLLGAAMAALAAMRRRRR